MVDSLHQMANRMDEIQAQMNRSDKYYERRFDSIEANFDHLSQGLSHLFNMIQNSFPVTEEQRQFFEGQQGPISGDDKDPEDGTLGVTKDKSVEDNPTKGEKSREMGESSSAPTVEGRSDKGKQAAEGGYEGGEGEADLETEYAPELDFSMWRDTQFDKELAKQLAILKEKEDILEKTSKLLDQTEEVQRQEKIEKQRIHRLKAEAIKMDAQTKIGQLWDDAKEVMSTPQWSPVNDAEVLKILIRYKEANPNNVVYMKALQMLFSRIITGQGYQTKELKIFVYLNGEGSHSVSLSFFEKRTLSELWIMMQKVPMCSKLNVLFREELMKFARRASPQIVDEPYQVKYLKNDILHSCHLQAKSMRLYKAKHLVWVEHLVRSSGFFSVEKQHAAEWLEQYCQGRIKKYEKLKKQLKQLTPLPVRPEGGPTETERVLDADLLLALKVIEEELEEGEIREEDTES
jgi:hypothetical protein